MQLDRILKKAVDKDASDVHLSAQIAPIMRLNTQLEQLDDTIFSNDEMEQLALYILGPEAYKVYEAAGEIDTSYRVEKVGNFRINIYRHQGKTAIAARIIKSEVPSLEELGLPETIGALARYPSGLILVTGPTGSGKSTTLASMIDIINSERNSHIVTLEDPIEYIHQNKMSYITQREIGIDSQDFNLALRSSLRQDPDVIMIGELRDLETIATAITAAETGHLVLATLHTINSAQTVERMVDVFPSHQQQQVRIQLANCLRAVISQRLLPNKTNTRMVVATELMVCTNAIRVLIREGKYHQIPNAIFTGTKFGMLTMDASLQNLIDLNLIDAGVTNFDSQVDSQLLDALSAGSVPAIKPAAKKGRKRA